MLFDIDGTLIRTRGAGVKAFARALESEFGHDEGTELIKFGGRTDPSLVRELFGHRKIEATPQNFERFAKAYLRWLEKLMPECGGTPCPGVLDFIQAIRQAPQPPLVGLLTGNIRAGARTKLLHFQMWEMFPFGGFGDDSEDRNQIAETARQRGSEHLGRPLAGEEVLVIGDTPLDIRCARHIGARVLAVGTGPFTAAQLREHQPDWAVDDLSSITAIRF